MSNIAPFYTTDLEATTALVLDRSSFLDSVTDAVTYEDKKPEAAKMVAVLEKNAFLSLIPAFLTDADIRIRQKAYLALGNLIASDNSAVAEAAFFTAYNALKAKKFIPNETPMAAIAYVLGNMAMVIKKWPSLVSKESSGETPILLAALDSLKQDLPSNVKFDLLWVFRHLERANLLKPSLLIELLKQKQKKTFRTALYLLGEQVSADVCEVDTVIPVYNYLEEALVKRATPFNTTHEHLWMLSNLVLEDRAAANFFDDEMFFDAIANVIRQEDDERSLIEATYVILNSLTKVSLMDLTHFRLQEVKDLLTIVLEHEFGHTSFLKEVGSMLSKVDAEIATRYKPVATEDDKSTVYEPADMEIDYEASWIPMEAEAAEIFAQAQPPCELPSFTIYNPPSALELLRKKAIFDLTSSTVYNLITLLEANNLAFTPIPDSTTLTVEDLKALEARGFAIVRGHIGINPALTVALYGTA